jgi:hypothetical protein
MAQHEARGAGSARCDASGSSRSASSAWAISGCGGLRRSVKASQWIEVMKGAFASLAIFAIRPSSSACGGVGSNW